MQLLTITHKLAGWSMLTQKKNPQHQTEYLETKNVNRFRVPSFRTNWKNKSFYRRKFTALNAFPIASSVLVVLGHKRPGYTRWTRQSFRIFSTQLHCIYGMHKIH